MIAGGRLGWMAVAVLALAGCGNGGSAAETRDRSAEGAEVTPAVSEGPSQPSGSTGAEPRPALTANRRETVDAKITRLFERNGAEFGASTPEDYLAKVQAFTARPLPEPIGSSAPMAMCCYIRRQPTPSPSSRAMACQRQCSNRGTAPPIGPNRRPRLRTLDADGRPLNEQPGRRGYDSSSDSLRSAMSRINSRANFCWRVDSWGARRLISMV